VKRHGTQAPPTRALQNVPVRPCHSYFPGFQVVLLPIYVSSDVLDACGQLRTVRVGGPCI